MFRSSNMSSKGLKRKQFSVEQKVQVIQEVLKGVKKADVCRKFDIANSTLQTILKKRDELLSAYERNEIKIKRFRKPQHEDIDKALLEWFKQQQTQNIPISGPSLKVKAEEFAKCFGVENFVCCNGWIDRFKARNGICLGKARAWIIKKTLKPTAIPSQNLPISMYKKRWTKRTTNFPKCPLKVSEENDICSAIKQEPTDEAIENEEEISIKEEMLEIYENDIDAIKQELSENAFFDQLWTRTVQPTLPMSWGLHFIPNPGNNLISISEMILAEDSTVAVRKKIILYEDSSIRYYVFESLVTISELEDKSVLCLEDLHGVVEVFHNLGICYDEF